MTLNKVCNVQTTNITLELQISRDTINKAHNVVADWRRTWVDNKQVVSIKLLIWLFDWKCMNHSYKNNYQSKKI